MGPKVEHPFHVVENLSEYRKARYRGWTRRRKKSRQKCPVAYSISLDSAIFEKIGNPGSLSHDAALKGHLFSAFLTPCNAAIRPCSHLFSVSLKQLLDRHMVILKMKTAAGSHVGMDLVRDKPMLADKIRSHAIKTASSRGCAP